MLMEVLTTGTKITKFNKLMTDRSIAHSDYTYIHFSLTTFFCLGGLKGGLLLDKKQCLCEGEEAHGPNFVFSSINHDCYSINYCFRFDKN